MKILYHHRTRGDGAEGVHIHEMANAFVELGHCVEFCCPKSAKRAPGLKLGMTGMSAADSKGIKGWINLRLRQSVELAYNAVSFTRLCWAIIRTKPDAVYERYSCYHFGGVLACKLCRVPILLEVNSTYAGRFPRRILGFKRLARWIENFDLLEATAVAVVSKPLQECVADRGVNRDSIVVTPNAVNAKAVSGFDIFEASERVRQELGLADRVVVGFVGSLRRWHGIEMLLRVIPEVIEQEPNVSFLIVGAGELEKDVESLRQELRTQGRLVTTGGVDHSRALELISAIDIGLMPHSNTWGSPMKILEYMAFGKLTVAPRLEPIEEIVDAGITGILFEPENEKEFMNAILAACRDSQLRAKIGANSRTYVMGQRCWTNNAQMVLDLLENRGRGGRTANA